MQSKHLRRLSVLSAEKSLLGHNFVANEIEITLGRRHDTTTERGEVCMYITAAAADLHPHVRCDGMRGGKDDGDNNKRSR